MLKSEHKPIQLLENMHSLYQKLSEPSHKSVQPLQNTCSVFTETSANLCIHVSLPGLYRNLSNLQRKVCLNYQIHPLDLCHSSLHRAPSSSHRFVLSSLYRNLSAHIESQFPQRHVCLDRNLSVIYTDPSNINRNPTT